jgi:hypothetical protein
MNQNQPLITALPREQAKMEFVVQYVLARARTIDNLSVGPGPIVNDAEVAWDRIIRANPYGLG